MRFRYMHNLPWQMFNEVATGLHVQNVYTHRGIHTSVFYANVLYETECTALGHISLCAWRNQDNGGHRNGWKSYFSLYF